MFNEIWLFAQAVCQATWALWSGGVVTVALAVCKWRWKKDLHWAWLVTTVAATVLVSSFLAWQDVYHQTQAQQTRIARLAQENTRKDGEIKTRQAIAEARQDEIIRLTAALSSRPQRPYPPPAEPEPVQGDGLRVTQKSTVRHDSSTVDATIQADWEMPNVMLEVACNAPIHGDVEIEAAAFPSCQVNNVTPIGDQKIRFTIISPTLSPRNAYAVTIESKQRTPPIKVLSVHKVG